MYAVACSIIKVMELSAHIFIPHNDSLQARVEAYQRVVRDYRQFMDNCSGLHQETVGEQGEVDQARQIYWRSLQQARQMVDHHDLEQARSQGYLSEDDIRELTQIQRQVEMEARRKQASDQSETTTDHHQHR